MESFLRRTVDKLAATIADGAAGDIHVVVGSEACDLDSAVSALCWAYYLSQTGSSDGAAAAASASVVVPLLAVRRRDYAATRVVPRAHLRDECGLSEDLLVFLDDLDLATLAASGRLALTLVDHNDVASWHGSDDVGSTVARVRCVIDHHRRSSLVFPSGCDVIIEQVGSCSTLIAERVLANAEVSADKMLLKMLYGAIVYDTVCLSPGDGRTTAKDESAVLAIEAALGRTLADRRHLFDALCRAKSDLSGAATADLLLSDKKVIAGSRTRLVVPSLTTHAQSLLGRAAFADDLRRFAADERCNAVVVMALGAPDDAAASDGSADGHEPPQAPLRRHLIVCSSNADLVTWIADALLASDLKPAEVVDTRLQQLLLSDAGGGLRVLEQSDHRQSRKQVLPLLQKIVADFESRSAEGDGRGGAVAPPSPSADPALQSDGAGRQDAVWQLGASDSSLASASPPAAWLSAEAATADGSSKEQQQQQSQAFDFFSFTDAAPLGGNDPRAPPLTGSSSPFGVGDFLEKSGDGWLTFRPAAASGAAAAAPTLAADGSSGASKDAVPTAAAAKPNPFFDLDPFGIDPFGGSVPVSLAAVGGSLATVASAGNPFGDPFGGASAGDPFDASTSGDPFGGASAGNPFGTSAFGVPFGGTSAGDPFGSASAGDPFGASASVGLAASANLLAFGGEGDSLVATEIDASLLSGSSWRLESGSAELSNGAAVSSTPKRAASAAVLASAAVPGDGGSPAPRTGEATALSAVDVLLDAHATALTPPTAGSSTLSGGAAARGSTASIASASATVADSPAAADKLGDSVGAVDEQSAEDGSASGGRLSGVPSDRQSSHSAAEAEYAAAAAAYADDEAFGDRTSTESSSPTADGSAPSKYSSFLSPSADLFRLTFVPEAEARGSSVSSVDSASAAAATGALPVDYPAAATAPDMLAELAAEAAAADAAAAAASATQDPNHLPSPSAADGVSSAAAHGRAVESGEAANLAERGAGGTSAAASSWLSAAVAMPAQSAAGAVGGGVVSGGAAVAAAALSLLPRHDLEFGGGGDVSSSSVPSTPNNSFYDGGMFDRFAAVALDGHKVTSRILQHQAIKHEAGSLSSWFTEELEEPEAAAEAAFAEGAGSSGLPQRHAPSSLHPSDGRRGAERGGLSLPAGSHGRDGAVPLTPANSFADSFRPPDGGRWPSATTGSEDVMDPLSQLTGSDMLQKVLQKKKASLIVDDDDDGPPDDKPEASSSSSGGFDSAISDRSPEDGGGSTVAATERGQRRRSVDGLAAAAATGEEGVFAFDDDDDDVTFGSGSQAAPAMVLAAAGGGGADGPPSGVGTGSGTSAAAAAAASPVADDRAAAGDSSKPRPADATSGHRAGVESTVAAAGASAAGVSPSTAEASTFVRYLASVDPLHGHLDLVAHDGASVRDLPAPLPSSSADGVGVDGFRTGRSASLGSAPSTAVPPGGRKRYGVADRLGAQIVEGVDIEELTASDATAAALMRRASLDSIGGSQRRLSAAAAPSPLQWRASAAHLLARAAAADTGPSAESNEHSEAPRSGGGRGSDGFVERAGAALAFAERKMAPADASFSAPASATAATCAPAPVAVEQQQSQLDATAEVHSLRCTSAEVHSALAERVVARALRTALAAASAAAGSDPAVAADDGGDDDDDDASALYAVASRRLVGRVLTEAKAELLSGTDGGAFGDDEPTTARKYSEGMIDAVLGDSKAEEEDASSEAERVIIEESVVPAAAGIVAAAPGADGSASASAEWLATRSPGDGSLEAMLASIEDVETAEDESLPESFIDSTLLQELGGTSADAASSSGSLRFGDQQQQSHMDTIPLDSSDDAAAAEWCNVTLAGREHRVDMRAIKPYCKLVSHGGLYDAASCSTLLVFTARYFPSRSLKNYGYVMENLLLYVLSGIELMVPEGRDYAVLYFHGGADRSQLPSMAFLKRCRDQAHARLRKSLRMLYLVHPTVWLRSLVLFSRAVVSSKFSRKIVYVHSLEMLRKVLSLEYVTIPAEVVEFDKQRTRAKK